MKDPVQRARLRLAAGLAVFLILFFGFASCVQAGVGGPWV